MLLGKYIKMYHDGNQADFGRKIDPPADRRTVSDWAKKKYRVEWDDKTGKLWLFSPRRPLIKE